MKRLIGFTAALCLLAIMVGCGGVTNTGTLAYVSNSKGTGFTVFTVNTDGTLTKSSISPQNTPANGPKVLRFSANGKWAYYLDNSGTTLYAYTRTGSGELDKNVACQGTSSSNCGGYPVGPGATDMVVSSSSTFIYVAEPNKANPGLSRIAVFQIDQTTGVLTQVASSSLTYVGYAIDQLVIAPGGSYLFGLSIGQQAVISWSLNSSGVLTKASSQPVGSSPTYMILAANGNYLYVLDAVDTTAVGTGKSPNIYGFTVSGGVMNPLANSPYTENPDYQGNYPTVPVAGVTTSDSRYLFVVNQGTHNISAFKISAASTGTGVPGDLSEVLGSRTTVDGVVTSTASPFDCGTGCSTPMFAINSPVNNALYVLDSAAGKIFQLQINQNTGSLRALNPASVSAESTTSAPTWITIR